MPDHVLLVGMMGAGKSTVGRRLAARMGRVFHDSDGDIIARTGMTVPEIFATYGEAAFRAEERKVLAVAACSVTPLVIAVAGGAVLDPESRRRIRRAGVVVWLKAEPWVLARRVGAGAGRPLLEHDPAGTMRRLDAQRRPVYQELADVTVESGWAPPGTVAERAERGVREWLAASAAPTAAAAPIGHGAVGGWGPAW